MVDLFSTDALFGNHNGYIPFVCDESSILLSLLCHNVRPARMKQSTDRKLIEVMLHFEIGPVHSANRLNILYRHSKKAGQYCLEYSHRSSWTSSN